VLPITNDENDNELALKTKTKSGKGNGATEYGMRKYSYCKDRTDVREFVWL